MTAKTDTDDWYFDTQCGFGPCGGTMATCYCLQAATGLGNIDSTWKETTMTKMRAKMRVGSVSPYQVNGETVSERVVFHSVPKTSGYTDEGNDEDNTFAKFTPSAMLDIYIANPALIGKYAPGDTFYVDFTQIG